MKTHEIGVGGSLGNCASGCPSECLGKDEAARGACWGDACRENEPSH